MGAGACGRVIDQGLLEQNLERLVNRRFGRQEAERCRGGLLGGWIGHDKRIDSVSGKESRVAQGIGAVGELGDGNHVGGIGWCGHDVRHAVRRSPALG